MGARIIRVVIGTNFGAGVNASTVAVPNKRRWHVLSASATLVTDATVANRIIRLWIAEGNLFYETATFTQTASMTVAYSAGAGVAHVGDIANGRAQFSMPVGLVLQGRGVNTGEIFFQAASGFQAGDDWSAMTVLVEEFA